jgi:ribosome maturation protein Sdo1
MPNDSFWAEFMEAIDEVKAQMDTGKSATNVLEDVIKSHERFVHPLIAEDVAVILSKEAYERQEALFSQPIFEMSSWYKF